MLVIPFPLLPSPGAPIGMPQPCSRSCLLCGTGHAPGSPSLPRPVGPCQPSERGLGHCMAQGQTDIACGDHPEPRGRSAAASTLGQSPPWGAAPSRRPRAQPPTAPPLLKPHFIVCRYPNAPATSSPFSIPGVHSPKSPGPTPLPCTKLLPSLYWLLPYSNPCAGRRRAGWHWPILYASKV